MTNLILHAMLIIGLVLIMYSIYDLIGLAFDARNRVSYKKIKNYLKIYKTKHEAVAHYFNTLNGFNKIKAYAAIGDINCGYVQVKNVRFYYKSVDQITPQFINGLQFQEIHGMSLIKDATALKVLNSRIIKE